MKLIGFRTQKCIRIAKSARDVQRKILLADEKIEQLKRQISELEKSKDSLKTTYFELNQDFAKSRELSLGEKCSMSSLEWLKGVSS